jgi:cytochrome c-type biogenesis protein CcmH
MVLAWTTLPLWRSKNAAAEGAAPASPAARRWATVLVALAVPALAVGMYAKLSNWDWDAASQRAVTQFNEDNLLKQMERKLESDPNDVEGWLMLGHSYTQIGRFARAVDAYQQAYDLTKGENVQAMTGLGEALALTDEESLAGRAGQLFDAALSRQPNDPKALWYGGMAALKTGKLKVGRDRLQLLLQADNIPEQMRGILQGKVDEINGELGESGSVLPSSTGATPSAPPSAPPGASAMAQAEPAAGGQQRSIKVAIKLAPDIQQQLTAPLPLFVLARDPAAGGPPLAVQRHSSTQLPMTVSLTERDAMIPSRSIASVPRVQIVARLSRSGAPQAQSGDFFGEATYEFGKNTGTVQITIDQRVP